MTRTGPAAHQRWRVTYLKTETGKPSSLKTEATRGKNLLRWRESNHQDKHRSKTSSPQEPNSPTKKLHEATAEMKHTLQTQSNESCLPSHNWKKTRSKALTTLPYVHTQNISPEGAFSKEKAKRSIFYFLSHKVTKQCGLSVSFVLPDAQTPWAHSR